MEITAEDREELNRFVEISKNKIPTYVNLINSKGNDAGQGLNECSTKRSLSSFTDKVIFCEKYSFPISLNYFKKFLIPSSIKKICNGNYC